MRFFIGLCAVAALFGSAAPHSLSSVRPINPLGEWTGPIVGLEMMGNFSLTIKAYSGSLSYFSYAVTLTPPPALEVAPIHFSAEIAEMVNPKETGRRYALDCLCEKESSICKESTVTRGVYSFISQVSPGGEGIYVQVNPPHFPFRPVRTLSQGEAGAVAFTFRRP